MVGRLEGRIGGRCDGGLARWLQRRRLRRTRVIARLVRCTGRLSIIRSWIFNRIQRLRVLASRRWLLRRRTGFRIAVQHAAQIHGDGGGTASPRNSSSKSDQLRLFLSFWMREFYCDIWEGGIRSGREARWGEEKAGCASLTFPRRRLIDAPCVGRRDPAWPVQTDTTRDFPPCMLFRLIRVYCHGVSLLFYAGLRFIAGIRQLFNVYSTT